MTDLEHYVNKCLALPQACVLQVDEINNKLRRAKEFQDPTEQRFNAIEAQLKEMGE